MPRQDRNQSRRGRLPVEQSLDHPESCTPEFLEACWRKSVKRDRIQTPYEAIESESLSGEATAAALELLVEVTGDEAFRTALLALRAYGLDKGGLKEKLKQRLRGSLDVRPAIRLVLPTMSNWRRRVSTDVQAARLTAAQYGIPGQSFATVVEELRKASKKWEASVASEAPAAVPPAGDTGRKLKVRWAHPWLGPGNVPLNEIRGVSLDRDGAGLAPDDSWWRARIHDGSFHLCGVIEATLESGKSSG